MNSDDQFTPCPKCGADMDWQDCTNGCIDGWFSLYEEDPLWYDPEDYERCQECHGEGGYLVCRACEARALGRLVNG